MRILFHVVRREFASYFSGALAVVFLVVFVAAAGVLTFDVGGFLTTEQADLTPFFSFHPWLYLILMPAIGMRLWAEERRSGTIEFLMTLPVATWQSVLGKFLAAWAFASIALALTFPIWITVNYLGDPDNGVILASYAGSFLMGGAFLALSCCISALVASQVTAFVIGVTCGFIMLMTSLDPVLSLIEGWAPAGLVDLVASLSFARHFDAITRGVLDARDLIYFLSFIALALFINILILDRRKNSGPMSVQPARRWRASSLSDAAVALSVVLFLALNALSGATLGAARLDLTERKLFTLSAGSLKVLSSIEEPVTLRLYETPQLIRSVPSLQVYSRQVSEVLTNFQQISGGKVRLQTVEATPFSVGEDEALGFGLQGFPLTNSGDRGYFGLVGTNSLDGLERIAFLDPGREALLEYDLTRIIHRLAETHEPKVGIIDGLGMFGSLAEDRRPLAVLDTMGADYALENIKPDATALPKDLDVLLVAHPVRLSDPLRYAIDQYALRGGATIVFVDPLAENSRPSEANPLNPEEPSSGLPDLFAAWGISMDPDKVVGDKSMAIQIVGVAGQRRVVAEFLPWLRLESASFNASDMATAQLQLMRMSSAGSIVPLPGVTTRLSPLLQSTQDSMLLERSVLLTRPDPNRLLDAFKPSGKRQTLAARVNGQAKTAFPNGAPAGSEAAGPQISTGQINLIVVADTDMLADSHVVGQDRQPISSNADFVLNAVDSLAGGNALAEVRRGGLSYRPFSTIDALEAQAEQTYRATEQRLTQELDALEQQRSQASPASETAGGDPLATSREQQNALAQSDAHIIELRGQLREVRAALRSDIEQLERWVRFANILLIPIVVIVLTAGLELWRRLRFRRYLRKQRGVEA